MSEVFQGLEEGYWKLFWVNWEIPGGLEDYSRWGDSKRGIERGSGWVGRLKIIRSRWTGRLGVVTSSQPVGGMVIRIHASEWGIWEIGSISGGESGVFLGRSAVFPVGSGVFPVRYGVFPVRSGVCPGRTGVFPGSRFVSASIYFQIHGWRVGGLGVFQAPQLWVVRCCKVRILN